MAVIDIETLIKADINTVFDLARDIDLHQQVNLKNKRKSNCRANKRTD